MDMFDVNETLASSTNRDEGIIEYVDREMSAVRDSVVTLRDDVNISIKQFDDMLNSLIIKTDEVLDMTSKALEDQEILFAEENISKEDNQLDPKKDEENAEIEFSILNERIINLEDQIKLLGFKLEKMKESYEVDEDEEKGRTIIGALPTIGKKLLIGALTVIGIGIGWEHFFGDDEETTEGETKVDDGYGFDAAKSETPTTDASGITTSEPQDTPAGETITSTEPQSETRQPQKPEEDTFSQSNAITEVTPITEDGERLEAIPNNTDTTNGKTAHEIVREYVEIDEAGNIIPEVEEPIPEKGPIIQAVNPNNSGSLDVSSTTPNEGDVMLGMVNQIEENDDARRKFLALNTINVVNSIPTSEQQDYVPTTPPIFGGFNPHIFMGG